MPTRKLSTLRRNMHFRIADISSVEVRTQLIRFGLGIGSKARCHQKLPFGPLVIKYRRQEIALGRAVAEQITVEPIP